MTAFDEKPHLKVDCLIREINIKYKYPFNFERSQLASIQDNFCSFSLLKNQNISKLSCHWFQSLFLRRHLLLLQIMISLKRSQRWRHLYSALILL